MKQKPYPNPHGHLVLEEIFKVRDFCDKHGIRWSKKREELLRQGRRGLCDVHAYKRYCRLLRRIHYEMVCVLTNQPILIIDSDRMLDIPYNRQFR